MMKKWFANAFNPLSLLKAILLKKYNPVTYDGTVHGFAANMQLVEHYQKSFNAFHLGMLHEYQIVVEGEHAKKLLKVYSYEWN